jgi:hypothetical protein
VPCGRAGLLVPIGVGSGSERIDCASHSLVANEFAVGVGVPANGCAPTDGPRLVVSGASGGVVFWFGLKDASKFCADDLRRMAGRCIWSAWVPTKPLAIPNGVKDRHGFTCSPTCSLSADQIMADITVIAKQFTDFYYTTFDTTRELESLYVR